MSDEWMNNTQEPETPAEPVAPQTEPAEPTATPSEPVAPQTEPAEPVAPQEPVTPAEPPVAPQPENRYASYTPYGASWQLSQGGTTPPPPPSAQPPVQPPKKKRNGCLIALVVTLVIVFVASTALAVTELVGRDNSGDTGTNSTTTTTSGDSANKPSLNIKEDSDADSINTAQIVADNLDVTVLINAYTLSGTEDFFGYSIESGDKTEQLTGQASGIVMSANGYIITNEHVVINDSTGEPYDRVEVQLYNGSVYDATVVGHDSDTDLAVIKIDASNLKVATFGNSDNVVLGERVVTIGCSGGLPWSISQGIISGKDRDVYDETGYQIRCLQIDATINPGNSGGPLFNSSGEVIGINSAKIVYDGYENLGFSIPITEAKEVIDDLIQYGKVTGRIELGITGYDVDQAGIVGFLIKTIDEDSCLQGTNVKESDVITAIDGVEISGRTELRNQLSKHKAGDQVVLSITRVTARKSNGGGYFGNSQYTYETSTFDATVALQEG